MDWVVMFMLKDSGNEDAIKIKADTIEDAIKYTKDRLDKESEQYDIIGCGLTRIFAGN